MVLTVSMPTESSNSRASTDERTQRYADPHRRRCPSPKTASHVSQGFVLAHEDTTKQATPRSNSSETYLGDPRAEQILAKVELPASQPIGGRFARLQFDRSYREHAKSLSLLLYPNWD